MYTGRRRTNNRQLSVILTEIRVMRGAGGAPRGLRAHQKPLRKRDRHRRPTRLPKNQNTQGKTSADATKKARRSGPDDRKPPSQPKRRTSSHESQETSVTPPNLPQSSARTAKGRNRQHARPHILPLPTSKGANLPKQSEWQRAKKEKRAAEEAKKAYPSNAGKARKLKEKMLANYALQRVEYK